MAIHNMSAYVTPASLKDIPYKLRERYPSFPVEFLVHMREQLRDPAVLMHHLDRLRTETTLLRDCQMAVPHTCMNDDIDHEFDTVVDKIEEVIQYVNNWMEEKLAGEKLAREYDNSFYARR